MSYKDETTEEREARWKRVLAMTDEEIEANIASDPDSQVPIEALRRGRMVWGPLARPDGSTVVPVELDAKTARWLESHPIDYQSFLSSVLKAYVASQQKHS